MNYLSVETISKAYGERTLFKDVTFGLDKGQKTTLVACNGTGKTTSLLILSDREAPDSGNVVFRKGIKVGILNQEPNLPETVKIRTCMFSKLPFRLCSMKKRVLVVKGFG